MQYYFAPLEGLTDSIYRQLHHKYFPGIDRYYTPFFSPTIHRSFTQKERRELQRADTLDFQVVPQVLTRNAEDFLWMANQCADAGYRELNLNLGCPSGTVTAKGKGSGALRDLEALDKFLKNIFSACPIAVSVKTRIGFSSPEEFPALLGIFNRYPIKELTVHPRTRTDFYKGSVDMDAFRHAVANSKNPLCYNGNLCSKEQIEALSSDFPTVDAVMLGRALIADPGMLSPGGTTATALEQFHDELLENYTEVFASSRNAMFRMKENWHYLRCRFDGGDKLFKQLRKTTDLSEYRRLTHEIFHNVPLAAMLTPDW
ncbi:MAG: tRNA-dihydrouridine synthase family protein [Oscillospiraceae bacterium]|nr:tRNA-dihydrouridine synthase family protein [Oscillospiraceae bacterium]